MIMSLGSCPLMQVLAARERAGEDEIGGKMSREVLCMIFCLSDAGAWCA